jgi:hypothetical protein
MPPPDLGRPARNAGLLMIIGGIFMALFAGCFFAVSFVFADPSALQPQQREQFQQIKDQFQNEFHVNAATVMKVVGGVIGVPAFLTVLLGLFVRKGQMWAIILGLLLTGGMLLLIVLSLAQSLLMMGRDPRGASSICVLAIPLALLGLQMYWLAKAVTSVGPLKVFNAQQQAYQWQMAQHAAAQQQYYQQMYQQQGYNYPSTPPPPPPPAEQEQGSGPNSPQ